MHYRSCKKIRLEFFNYYFQNIRELRALGLAPDFIACRSKNPVSDSVRSKISLFCHVPEQNVINVYDVSNIYRYIQNHIIDYVFSLFFHPAIIADSLEISTYYVVVLR